MKTALFDFDGVLVDTEPIYDIFWNKAPERYGIRVDNFAEKIKGITMSNIMDTWFSDHSDEIRQMVLSESTEYERTMALPPLPGSFEFVRMLKQNEVQTGLVTSSDMHKVNRAIRQYELEGLFDTIVTSDRITRGKPDPMCYLLAAADLKVVPEHCLVFEDSFAGIEAGNAAGMRVIGLSTTNPAEKLQGKVYKVIPDFKNVRMDDYLKW